VGDEFRELSLVTVLDARGKVICASDATRVGQGTAAAPLIARAQQSNSVVLDYFASPQLVHEPVVAALGPIGQTDGPARLYVAASRTVASLFARPPSYKNGFSALADSHGKILQIFGLDRESDAYKHLQDALNDRVIRGDALIEARDSWAVAAPLIEGRLYVVQGGPAGPLALGDILRTSWALLAPLLTWLAAVAVAWLIAELNIVRPLTTLEKLARGYARGEESITPASFANAPAEIASLRRTLAAMAKIMRGREQRLSEALREERALLRELHHRVNNNLQLVASLLSIQSRAAPNAEQKLGFARAHESIQLLAMVQKRIYASGEVHENIPLDIMAGDIAHMMVRSRGDGFALELRLEQAYVDFDHAVFWTFLIGESLTFALDHLEGGPKTPLIVSVLNNNGAVEFSVSAPGATLRNVEASAARRIIDAFGREIGATITYDQNDPLGVHLVANAAAAPEQVLAEP
jgi:two-component sensor histidine kinase